MTSLLVSVAGSDYELVSQIEASTKLSEVLTRVYTDLSQNESETINCITRQNSRLVIVPFGKPPVPVPKDPESVVVGDLAREFKKLSIVIIPETYTTSFVAPQAKLVVQKPRYVALAPQALEKNVHRLRDPNYTLRMQAFDALQSNALALYDSNHFQTLSLQDLRYLLSRPALAAPEQKTLEATLRWMANHPDLVREDYAQNTNIDSLLDFVEPTEAKQAPVKTSPLTEREYRDPKSLLFLIRIDSIYDNLDDGLIATLNSAVGQTFTGELTAYLTQLNTARVQTPADLPSRTATLANFARGDRVHIPKTNEFSWDPERSSVELEFTRSNLRINGRLTTHYRTALSDIRMVSGVYKWGIKVLRNPTNSEALRVGIIQDESGNRETKNTNDTSYPLISLYDGRCSNRTTIPSFQAVTSGQTVWLTYTCATGKLTLQWPGGTFDYPNTTSAPVRAAVCMYQNGFAELVFEP